MKSDLIMELTSKQIKQLAPLKRRVDDAHMMGKRGVLLGQIWINEREVRVCFVEADKAQQLIEIANGGPCEAP